ncbi:beta-hexosaminidase subunit beta-like [Haliotis rufescens]|uniref:beta-hexosaminidase subunit beta-like n=1 Tax=Haliotis rufescens TaxID=6454 RepID=UPI001EB09C06|nr:beta-hexosaminidase subunit beta-like [Haliotis rufescens]
MELPVFSPGGCLPVAIILLCQVWYGQGHVTYIAARLPLQGQRAKPGSPWPLPAHMTQTDHIWALDPASFSFTSNIESCDILTQAFQRYRKLSFFDRKSSKPTRNVLEGLRVNVKDAACDGYPSFEMDESYTLNVTSSAVMAAQSVWGALRGLETFSQLIYMDGDQHKIRETYIEDRPRFQHRGSMADTARHYIPVPVLLKHLDAMAYNKLNVFHWHIVDDQSFPYVSTTFPELSQKGAYSSKHLYTQDNISAIIEYARMRGIRVIPEFDTPGHAEGWGRALQYLLTTCWADGEPARANYSDHAQYENLDPTQNATYDFLSEFFSEVKDVFKDEFLHMGLDEAHYMCWKSSPNISDFMTQMGYKPGEFYRLEQYFNDRLLDIISGMRKRYLVWQDPIDNGGKVASNALVQVWKDTKQWPDEFDDWQTYLRHVTEQGYDVIFSSCWYLNVISYGEDWLDYYKCDPLDFNGTETQRGHVVGGEACLWAEYVDGTNFLSRYWPRASAVAERLWSPGSVTDVNAARFRIDQQRCRMVRRGIPAQPILPGYCGDYDFGFQPELEPAQRTDKAACTGSSDIAILNIYLLIATVLNSAHLATSNWMVIYS